MRATAALPLPLLLILVLLLSLAAQAFEVQRIATGLDRPVFLTAPPGDRDRVFVVEQHSGDIHILRLASGNLEATPFLTVSGVSTGNEQGLLGLAFHPDYASNGFFYVYYTNPATQVRRYQVSADPDIADAGSAISVMTLSQPQSNHNGGWLGFGPDGLLYLSVGDGGAANDNGSGHTAGTGNAQDLTNNLLGKILRIDVDGDDFPADATRNYSIPAGNPFAATTGDDEIWLYGLRNPWRPSFDRETGDLYIADVGQNLCEEVNVHPASAAAGANFGWRLREGVIATPSVGGAAPAGAIDPIFDYPHFPGFETCSGPGGSFSGVSITGGYAYRGPIPELAGRYFFADFSTARLWSLLWDGSDPSGFDGSNYTSLSDHTGDPNFSPDVGSFGAVASFGEDDLGNLYLLDLNDGEVFQLPEPAGPLALAVGALLLLRLRRSAGSQRRQ